MQSTAALKTHVTWIRGAAVPVLAVAGLLLPALGLPQAITGPLVNAVLIVTAELAGVGPATLVGTLTPLSAVLGGILPLPALALIPFIALGNGLLVSTYAALRRRRGLNWLAAASVKFAWLYAVSSLLVAHPIRITAQGAGQAIVLPPALVQAMQWPQLLTALAGGLIARGVLRALRHRLNQGEPGS